VQRVVGVVQARMGSSRLPGKVLRCLAGRTVLEWVVRAARCATGLDDLVVATTRAAEDDAIVDECRRLDVDVARGDRDDVLSRFLQAIDGRAAHGVARFTADCPLLDPSLITTVVGTWSQHGEDLDHLSTANPRCLPRGLDVEVAATDALRALERTLNEPGTAHHRTHVTSYLYNNPDRFRVAGLVLHPDASDLRITLDTVDDLSLLEAVVARIGDRPPHWREVVRLLREDPGLRAMNAQVTQKNLVEG
jgi:spore coat polysaccharide biosynthesis protein SpsF